MQQLNYSFSQELSSLELGTFILLSILVRTKPRFKLLKIQILLIPPIFVPDKFKFMGSFKNADKIHALFLDLAWIELLNRPPCPSLEVFKARMGLSETWPRVGWLELDNLKGPF